MTEENKETLNPLSVPLEKEAELGRTSGSDKTKPLDKKKRISQKDFLQSVYQRIDERIEEKINTGSAISEKAPSGLTILIILMVFPFIFRGGSELYELGKTSIPAYFGLPPLKLSTTKNLDAKKDEELSALLRQNQILIDQNRKLKDSLESFRKKSAKRKKKTVVSGARTETFSFKKEKKKLYDISGLDFDDPVTGSKTIGKIRSAKILKKMINSFDRILLNASQHSISEFHVKNAVEGKKQALARLKKFK